MSAVEFYSACVANAMGSGPLVEKRHALGKILRMPDPSALPAPGFVYPAWCYVRDAAGTLVTEAGAP